MPPQRRLSIRTPNPQGTSSQQYSDPFADATNQQALNTLRAQYARYKKNKNWTSENDKYNRRNEERFFQRKTRELENRRPMCQKFTNAITGAVKSVCGIQRHRTHKARTQRKKTRRVR
jgi:hypothetical protein